MKKVLQIDLENGNVIKVWDSSASTSSVGFNVNRIMLVCKGQAKKSSGYFWVYEDKNLQEKYKTYPENYIGKESIRINKKRVVLLDNHNFDVIKTYESRDEVAKSFGTYSSAIMRALRDKINYNDYLLFDEEYYFLNKEEIKNKFLNEFKEKCLICNIKFKNLRSLASHIQFVHNVESIDYTIKYFYNGIRPTCKLCDKETRYCTYEFKQYCNDHCKEAMKFGGMIGGKAEAWNRGKTKFDDDRILRHSMLVSGENNHFYGKHHTNETKDKLSINLRLSEKELLERFEKVKDYYLFPDFDYEKYKSRQEKITCVCVKCKRKFDKKLSYIEKGSLCKFCYPFTVSKSEIEIGNYVENELKIPIIRNDRNIIKPKELDILCPENNLAIEYNGLYWHKDNGSKGFNKNYHQTKTDSCKEKNIKLFHIFSDEWDFKQNIVKNMLKYKLGKVDNKIGARECVAREISKEEGKQFFEDSHIAGNTKAKVYFALIYDDEIISAISLRTPLHKKYKNMIELARFATKGNWNVSGGFSKLLNSIKKYCLANGFNGVISYADLRTGTGNVYEQSGFEKINDTGLSYWYTDGITRYDRFSFRAKNNKTEKQIAKENGVYKIYGCKNSIFILKL